ncbi:hypothetical protein BGZ74_005549, partial [Mortierella antarctica]
MRSLSTFTVLLLALMATLAMLSYTSATPIEAPANTDVQDPKSDPPSVNDDGENFVPINDDGDDDEMSSPIDILNGHDDDDYHHKKCYCWKRCKHYNCWWECNYH